MILCERRFFFLSGVVLVGREGTWHHVNRCYLTSAIFLWASLLQAYIPPKGAHNVLTSSVAEDETSVCSDPSTPARRRRRRSGREVEGGSSLMPSGPIRKSN